MPSAARRLLPTALFFALPFALLWWLLPFAPFAWTVGADYAEHTPSAQLNFMWAVWRGTFPVYMPGFDHGHSTAAMTLGQLYHPITWLATVMPGYWNGRALEWETTLRLLSLGGAHLALFRLLRRIRVAPVVAFLATMPAVYNLRMLDSLRFGASFESYVGMLLVLASTGFVFVERRSRGAVFALAASTYWLVVGGHPQWAFLELVATGLFALSVPWVISCLSALRPEISRRRVLEYVARITVGFGSGLLLAAPYLLPFYVEFLRTNATRAEGSYAFTLEFGDSVLGELASFLFPLHADVDGAFGGSALLLLVALFPLLVFVVRVPRSLLALVGLALMGFLFALGDATPLHALFVAHVPLFGSFRAPGRAVLWVVPAIVPVLAWLGQARSRRPLLVLGVLGAAVVIGGALARATLLPAPESERHTPIQILALGGRVAALDREILALALVTMLFLASASALPRHRVRLLMGALAAALVSTSICLANGTWRQPKVWTITSGMIAKRWKSSPYPRVIPGFGMEHRSVTAYRTAGLRVPLRFGAIVHDVVAATSDDDTLAALVNGDPRLFVDELVTPPATEARGVTKDSVDLVYNTTNRFVFDALAATPGELVLGVPSLPGFRATVDGRSAPVTRANAIFPSVPIGAGPHRVELRFVSWPFLAGAAVAALTALGWVISALRPRPAVAIVASLLVLGAGGIVLERWLYEGPSFGTRYHWQPDADESPRRPEARP